MALLRGKVVLALKMGYYEYLVTERVIMSRSAKYIKIAPKSDEICCQGRWSSQV